jgi:hypothetical protein
MFCLDTNLKWYLHREAVDFRKSINGLAELVEQTMGLAGTDERATTLAA